MNYVIFTFSLIIALACFWFSLKMIRLYIKVKRWNKVEAAILSKEMFIHPKYSSTRTPYGLKVEYSYLINNQECKGNKVYLVELMGGHANHMKKDAENRLEKIAPTMSIFVNPNNIQESVMYCKGIGLYIFVLFMGFLSILIGLTYL